MDKAKLQEYAELKKEISRLEDLADEIRPFIIESMLAETADKINLKDVGTFTLSQKRTWAFSEDVEIKRADLKAEEAKEKADGTANYEETPILKFTAKKDKEDILG